MSTKIYNGIILENTGSTRKLWEFWNNARKEMLPVLEMEYKKAFFKSLVTTALNLNGYQCHGPYLPFKEYTGTSMNDLKYFVHCQLSKLMEKNRIADTVLDYDSELDFDVSVGIYPVGRKTLALPFINNPELSKKFFTIPGVKDYGYWDNTDRPEDITARQWSQRKKDWDTALPGIGVFRECGPTMQLLGFEDIRRGFDIDGVDTDEILKDLTESAAKYEMFEQILKYKGISNPEVRDIMDANDEVRKNPDEIAKLAKEIETKVKTFLEM